MYTAWHDPWRLFRHLFRFKVRSVSSVRLTFVLDFFVCLLGIRSNTTHDYSPSGDGVRLDLCFVTPSPLTGHTSHKGHSSSHLQDSTDEYFDEFLVVFGSSVSSHVFPPLPFSTLVFPSFTGLTSVGTSRTLSESKIILTVLLLWFPNPSLLSWIPWDTFRSHLCPSGDFSDIVTRSTLSYHRTPIYRRNLTSSYSVLGLCKASMSSVLTAVCPNVSFSLLRVQKPFCVCVLF